MKMLFLYALLVVTPLASATTCFLIGDKEKIEFRTHPPAQKWVRCPLDSDGKFVTNVQDIVIAKLLKQDCSGIEDCRGKIVFHCPGNKDAIIDATFSEYYCPTALYSSTRRSVRMGELVDRKLIEDLARTKSSDRLISIKAQCDSATGLLKLICLQI